MFKIIDEEEHNRLSDNAKSQYIDISKDDEPKRFVKVKHCEDGDIMMPFQPIRNKRFVSNRIVQKLLETSPLNMKQLMGDYDFSIQEKIQLFQLIGYSLEIFKSLPPVNQEIIDITEKIEKQELSDRLIQRLLLLLKETNEENDEYKDIISRTRYF